MLVCRQLTKKTNTGVVYTTTQKLPINGLEVAIKPRSHVAKRVAYIGFRIMGAIAALIQIQYSRNAPGKMCNQGLLREFQILVF